MKENIPSKRDDRKPRVCVFIDRDVDVFKFALALSSQNLMVNSVDGQLVVTKIPDLPLVAVKLH